MKFPSLVNGSVLLAAVLLSLPLAAQTIVPIPPAQGTVVDKNSTFFPPRFILRHHTVRPRWSGNASERFGAESPPAW